MKLKQILTGLIVFAAFLLPAICVSASSDSSAALAEKWIAAWNSHDADKFLTLFTDDVYYEDVTFGEVSHNTAELRKFYLSEIDGVPDLTLKLDHVSIYDGHATIEWTFSGTDKGIYKTGKKFSVRGVSVIEMRGGKISRNLDFYDLATVMRQVGVLTDPK